MMFKLDSFVLTACGPMYPGQPGAFQATGLIGNGQSRKYPKRISNRTEIVKKNFFLRTSLQPFFVQPVLILLLPGSNGSHA
jgi:hypothetical protein